MSCDAPTVWNAVECSLRPTALLLIVSACVAVTFPVYGLAIAVACAYGFVTNILYTVLLSRTLFASVPSPIGMFIITGKFLLLFIAVRLLALLPTGAIVSACVTFLIIVSWGAARLHQDTDRGVANQGWGPGNEGGSGTAGEAGGG